MDVILFLRDALRDRLDEERDRLPLWLAVFMGAGVLGYYGLRFEPRVGIGVALAVPALAGAMYWPGSRLVLAPIAAAALGFGAAQFATARMPPIETNLPHKAVIVTGTVAAVELLPQGRRVLISPSAVSGVVLGRAVRIRLRNNDPVVLATGDSVRIRALIRSPAGPAYPGAWDLQRDAFYSGLGASGFALGPATRTAIGAPSGAMRLVQRLREIITGRVTAVIPGAPGAICVTLLTGTAMAIPPVDREAFRISGLAHLLAVAGLHIGIVMGFAFGVARLGFALSEHASLFWPTRKLAALCALVAGGGYMVLTGMHVPIIRSFVMACLVTLALMLDRRPLSLRGLALAGMALMLVSPEQVPDVSFQMSFGAVAALIAGYEALRPWLRRLRGEGWRRRMVSHLVALSLTSLLAGSASAPFAAYHFGHVQAYFVLANIVAVPLAALWVMPAGLIALALMPLHLEVLALVPMGWGARLILDVARLTAMLPAATGDVPHIPIWGLCVFSLGLAWLCLWRTDWRMVGVALMAAGLASPLLARPPDILVSDDGHMIALRTRQAVFLQQVHGGSRFTRDAWAQYWAVDGFLPMPPDPGESRRRRMRPKSWIPAGPVAVPRGARLAPPAGLAGVHPGSAIIRCAAGVCLLRPYADRPGAMLARGARHPAGCGAVSVIVSAVPARRLCPRPWPALVDRFTVWRDGSAAIWLDKRGARVLTDREARGARPWVPPPPRVRHERRVVARAAGRGAAVPGFGFRRARRKKGPIRSDAVVASGR